MELSPTLTRFVLHWGEMGARWGVNRTVSQIHALLYLTGRPMHADELCETLVVARSNVSTSLRELQNWGLVRLVHLSDDRRDHYETSTHVWELMRTIVRERQRRVVDEGEARDRDRRHSGAQVDRVKGDLVEAGALAAQRVAEGVG